MRAELASLESRINHRFAHPEILLRALTHSSHANEARGQEAVRDNERLEFLGDSILGFLISEALMERFPEYHEGDLSRLKAHLVSAVHLYAVARRLDLGNFLQLGRSEEMGGGRAKRTLLVDALEAVIAAIYLDGGIGPVREFVASHVLDTPFEQLEGTDASSGNANFKGALQELAQARKLPRPHYVVLRESGSDNSKTFTVEARVGTLTAQAEGRTKKIAAQRAARSVYERLLPGTHSP
ncbi:MAG TPA: ribonuclease III [Bryobacteraceae bacterium]|nr:ribonuclease III [Bryobacteraceae bacterium]